MSYHAERERFIAQFVSEKAPKGYNVMRRLEDARTIMRHAATHGRLAVAECNTGLDEYGQLRMKRAESAITAICDRYKVIHPKFGGDPRGYTVKLLFPSGIYNTLGGPEEGYGVPQR